MRKTLVILACAALVACDAKKQQPVAQAAAPVANAGSALPKALKDALPPAPQPAATSNALSGKVLETMNSGGYTYLRVGDQWAAVRETKLKKGDDVTITTQMVMDDFESKTLNRKFDHIIFGTLGDGAGSSVADVWAGKGGFKDKPVTVRGKVVKFLPEIMGKNWLHLRDGSGSQEKGDNDITVTTNDVAKVGDVVTVTGTLRVEKDFGAGYQYPVIIEDAKLKP